MSFSVKNCVDENKWIPVLTDDSKVSGTSLTVEFTNNDKATKSICLIVKFHFLDDKKNDVGCKQFRFMQFGTFAFDPTSQKFDLPSNAKFFELSYIKNYCDTIKDVSVSYKFL